MRQKLLEKWVLLIALLLTLFVLLWQLCAALDQRVRTIATQTTQDLLDIYRNTRR